MNCFGVLFLVSLLIIPSFGYSDDQQPLHNVSHSTLQRHLKNKDENIERINSNLLALFYQPDTNKASLSIHGLWPNIAFSKEQEEYTCCCDNYIQKSTYNHYNLKTTSNFLCMPLGVNQGSKTGTSYEKDHQKVQRCAVPEKDNDNMKTVTKNLGDLWKDADNNDQKFWVQEFIKHGTCSGSNFVDYFTKTKALYDTLTPTIKVPLLDDPNAGFSLEQLRKKMTASIPKGSKQYIAHFQKQSYYRIQPTEEFITAMNNRDLHYVFKCNMEENDGSKTGIVPKKKNEEKKRFLSEVVFCLPRNPSSGNDRMPCKSILKALDETQDCFSGNGFYI